MNRTCETCDVEKQCRYEYKPCDCADYRKFKEKPAQSSQVAQTAKIIQFPVKGERK